MESKKKKTSRRRSSNMNLKIIVLGDSGVGKTCLINRYVSGFYADSFTATLGVDFKIKNIETENGGINLQIWDTAGQQRFKTITKSYFNGCLGVVLAFSLDCEQTFKNVESWLKQLEQHTNKDIIKILVGTKVDIPDARVIEPIQCSDLTSKHQIQYFQVSSKTGYNVDNVFEALIQKITEEKKLSPLSGFCKNKSIKLKTSDWSQYLLKKCEC